MAYLERQGVRIFYEEHGQGRPILLTHGFGASSHMWRGQVDALAGSRRVIVWEMRGHGRSDSPDDPHQYSEDATVADMVAVLDACAVDHAVVGGLSLGGYMSLAFLLRTPDRAAGLMLFDTGPGFRKGEARAGWNDRALGVAIALETEGLAALGQGEEVQGSGHRSAHGLARAARGMLTQHDARVIDSLPHVDIPTLVLVGEKDRAFLAGTDYMAARIPGVRKVVVPDAGHAANIHQPEAFNKAVTEFLDGIGW